MHDYLIKIWQNNGSTSEIRCVMYSDVCRRNDIVPTDCRRTLVDRRDLASDN